MKDENGGCSSYCLLAVMRPHIALHHVVGVNYCAKQEHKTKAMVNDTRANGEIGRKSPVALPKGLKNIAGDVLCGGVGGDVPRKIGRKKTRKRHLPHDARHTSHHTSHVNRSPM